jgi:hypothetical protein
MNKDKVVSREQFCPARLATVEDFGTHKDFEVFVVRKDRNGVFGAFTVMAPTSESGDNSKHFTIVNVVVAFSGV